MMRMQPMMPWSNMPWGYMPMPSIPPPFFDGTNVSKFLRSFDEFCDEYGREEVWRALRVPSFYTRDIGIYLRTLPEYAAKEWVDMKAVMMKEWENEDDE